MYLTQTQVRRVKELLPVYSLACTRVSIKMTPGRAGFPVLVLAGIHYRESEFALAQKMGGPFQFDPGGEGEELKARIKKYTQTICKLYEVTFRDIDNDIETAALVAAHELFSKVRKGYLYSGEPRILNEDTLWDAVWGYNGRAKKHNELWQTGMGSEEPDWKWSPYVSNDPQNGVILKLCGTLPGVNGERINIERPDPRPGARAIYNELTKEIA